MFDLNKMGIPDSYCDVFMILGFNIVRMIAVSFMNLSYDTLNAARKDTDGILGTCQLHAHINGFVYHQHWVNRFLFHCQKN